ncbi:hypothetical protein ACQPW1_37505 [Nocardia sp. CA-128927]|uniref:hypothetical protein n=1 Tax=Nocardia sp. CA-128927 TaxID=3239975 RepID=UPI003D96D991
MRAHVGGPGGHGRPDPHTDQPHGTGDNVYTEADNPCFACTVARAGSNDHADDSSDVEVSESGHTIGHHNLGAACPVEFTGTGGLCAAGSR